MIKSILVLTLLVFFSTTAKSAKFPSFLKKCNRKQSNFEDCVLKAATNGVEQLEKLVKHLNLPSVNPFTVSEVKIKGQGVVAMDQNYKNVEIYGLTNVDLDTFKFDFDQKTISVVAFLPKLFFLSDYEFNGKILLLAVEGSGRGNITLENVRATFSAKFEELKKSNKTVLKIVSNELKITPELIHFNFENIFRGNEEISKNINQVMNDNWKEVYADVESGYTEVVSTILINLLNQFFAKVSYEEAFN